MWDVLVEVLECRQGKEGVYLGDVVGSPWHQGVICLKKQQRSAWCIGRLAAFGSRRYRECRCVAWYNFDRNSLCWQCCSCGKWLYPSRGLLDVWLERTWQRGSNCRHEWMESALVEGICARNASVGRWLSIRWGP